MPGSCVTADAMHLILPAVLESIDAADEAVATFLARHAVPIDRFAVRIILREAMLNAVIHGSAEDPGKQVELDVEMDVHGLCLTIRDRGPGFAWWKVWEHPETLLDSGRGLPLMRVYASEVRFNEVGNQVTLVRNYAPQAALTPASAGEAQ